VVVHAEGGPTHVLKDIRYRRVTKFLQACRPPKGNDTSDGVAIDSAWMIDCAIHANAELVVVSRDGDYVSTYDSKSYIDDHLRQEFSNRVSQKRELLLYTRLADALKHLHVAVTHRQATSDADLVEQLARRDNFLSQSKPMQDMATIGHTAMEKGSP
ncbi:imidazole glycerol phosphate synthase, partial [Burkholderia pseudomallei]|uniref:imidazole glycerol phosphate synthase n=1 Tax=Burkholderia pseudomallei TaxID=28450 RepID=UPI0021F7A60F